jgi:molybdate transport system substrate-binding protein
MQWTARAGWLVVGLAFMPISFAQPIEVHVHAAGSLREAMVQLAQAFEKTHTPQTSIKLTFGASGLLKDRIVGGERTDVFASANTAHPQALHKLGMGDAPQVFAKNRMSLIAQPHLLVNAENVLDTMLNPVIKLGTSTPKADPAGDYAWLVFEKAESLQPGARNALVAKALQLAGGPQSPRPPAGQASYAWLMSTAQADVFLTYCTNATQTLQALPQLKSLDLPSNLQVEASYGLIALQPAGRDFVNYVHSVAGQAILRRAGFAAPVN